MINVESSEHFIRFKHSSSEESTEEPSASNLPDDDGEWDSSYDDLSDHDEEDPSSCKAPDFNEFYRSLFKKRIVTTALAQRIFKMKSNEKRVKLLHSRLFDTLTKLKAKQCEKSDSRSGKHRTCGLKFFLLCKYDLAVQEMTKSIVWARTKTVMGQAYASRSNLFYKLNMLSESLRDATMALVTDIPESSRTKLVERVSEIEQRLGSDGKRGRKFRRDYRPVIEPAVIEIPNGEKHESIQSASKHIDITYNEQYGRHIKANRDLRPSEVVAVEQPFITWSIKSDFLHCHHCMKLCYNPIPCDKCARTVYCTATCKSKAFREYHEFECEVMIRGKHVGLISSDLWGLKLILKTESHPQSAEENKDTTYRSDRLKEILDLSDAFSRKAPPFILLPVIVRCAIIYHFMKFHTSYFKKKPNSRRLKKIFRHKLVTHLGIAFGNKFRIVELIKTFTFIPEVIGYGLYALGGLFNHSCTPNIMATSNGTTLILRTLKKIVAGEQCFVSYSITYEQDSLDFRQKILMTRYNFICTCMACEKNWPTQEYLVYKTRVTKAQDRKYINTITLIDTVSDNDSANAVIKTITAQINIVQRFEPCLEMTYLKRGFEICCLWMGNVRMPLSISQKV